MDITRNSADRGHLGIPHAVPVGVGVAAGLGLAALAFRTAQPWDEAAELLVLPAAAGVTGYGAASSLTGNWEGWPLGVAGIGAGGALVGIGALSKKPEILIPGAILAGGTALVAGGFSAAMHLRQGAGEST